MPALCLVFAVSYLLFLFASVSFLDAWTQFDNRILLPLFLVLVIASTALVWSVREVARNRTVWPAFILVVLVSWGLNLPQAASEVADVRVNGRAFASRAWKDSQALKWVRSVPRGTTIYSNGPDVIRFYTGRSAKYLPRLWSARTLKTNLDYDDQFRDVRQEVNEGRATVLYFYRINFRPFLPRQEDINLPVTNEFDDGVVFGTKAR